MIFVKKRCIFVFLVFWALVLSSAPVGAQSRLKDISDFEGVRDNVLVGYGLVVGLAGTGDSMKSSPFTLQSLVGMLERLGVNVREQKSLIKSKNVAAVMVTASLPPFARQGSTIDVTVSALGESSSLRGGTLMVTPLVGADGKVYAVAQGQLAVGGFSAQGKNASAQEGVPTSGRISSGAIIEREIPFKLNDMGHIHLTLRNPDFTTAQRISQAINVNFGLILAKSKDSGTVQIRVPLSYKKRLVKFLTRIEQLHIQPDQVARVIIDEKTGTIVMGENVRISKVAIAQGNLMIRVQEFKKKLNRIPTTFNDDDSDDSDDSDDNDGGGGQQLPAGYMFDEGKTKIDIDKEGNTKLFTLDDGVSLEDLVNGLNRLGVSPRDMIVILQAIKASGALQAEIEVM